MKKTFFLSAALALASSLTFAHTSGITIFSQGQRSQGTVDERAKRQADRINAAAQLSTDQYAKVLAITKDFAGQRDAAKSSGAQEDALKAKLKAIGQQEDQQLKAVLTADQYAKMEEARKEQHHGSRGK